MAKTTAPLLGFGASGQIGKSNVHASWKGVSYTRRYVIPSNPNTVDQQTTRNLFAWLTAVWKVAPLIAQDPFTAYAKGKPLTNRNGFMKYNVAQLREETTLANMVFSPGAHGGIACSVTSVTPGSGTLTVVAALPTVPTQWTYQRTIAVALLEQSPSTPTNNQLVADEDTTTGYTPVLTGLTGSAPYRIGVFMHWKNGIGQDVYGPSVNTTGTPS